jgi:hypothetical protein
MSLWLVARRGQLALRLVAGEIAYETACTHLKNIFSKTGTCRQAELVIVIVTALPQLRLSSPVIEPREAFAQRNKSLPQTNKSPEGGLSD